mmetsp:Transcript_16201/g.44798  ORF Transcript_16201/g.44798 Transcript_16201/m.44798 type:complete len:337 (+) Transcript_16201:507-1517(+)
MPEASPLDCVRLRVQLLHDDARGALEGEACLQGLHGLLLGLLRLEDREGPRARVQRLQELLDGRARVLLGPLGHGFGRPEAQQTLLQLVEAAPQATHLGLVQDLGLIRPGEVEALLQVFIEGLLDGLLVLLPVPSDGHADEALTSELLDVSLQILLHVFRALDRGQAHDHRHEVLHGLVLVVHFLESPQLINAVGHAHQEAAEVDNPQECNLRPHQSLLPLVAPHDQDAVFAGDAELACAEPPEVRVDELCEAHPGDCHEHGPDHEEDLEVEVQHHARARDLLFEQVRGEGEHLTHTIIILLHLQLRLLPGPQSVMQSSLVHRRPEAPLEEPDGDQ